MVAKTDLLVTISARDRASPSIKNLQSTIIRFVGAVSAAIAGLATVAFPVKQAAEFEKELKNVQKTTGFVDEDIKRLGDSLSQLSTELVTPADDLARIAAVAGQLGLGREGAKGIREFTETVAIAATALDLAADQAAIAGARIKNIFALDIGAVQNVFAGINELSNTTTASAEQLIDVLQRIGATAGLAFEQSSALAATAIDLGVSQEVAGTSLAKVFSRLQSESEDFAEALGVSIGEFIGLGALERFQLFISTLATQSEQLRAQNIRELAGGGRIFVTIDKFVNDAATGGLRLAENLQTANDSFAKGTSAVEEYGIQTDTLLSAVALLGNSFAKLSRDVGTQLLNRLSALARDLAEFFQSDEARDFGRVIAEQFESTVEAVTDIVKAFGSMDVSLQNIIATVKVFISIGLIKIIKSLILSTALWNAQLLITIGRFTGINRLLVLFGVASASSLGVTQFNLRNIGTQLLSMGKLLVRLAGVGAVVAAVGFGLFKGLEAAGVEFQTLFENVANFFGFISERQARIQREEAERLRSIRKAIEENEAIIREAQTALAENRFGTTGQVIPIRFDAEGSTEDFNRQVNEAVGGLGNLESAERAVGIELKFARLEQEKIRKEIEGQIDAVAELEARSTAALAQDRGVGGDSFFGEGDLTGDAAAESFDEINRRLQITQTLLDANQRTFARTGQAISDLEVIEQDLQDETDKLSRKFAESFDLATNKALELRAALEENIRDIAIAEKELAEIGAEIDDLSDATPGSDAERAKREKEIQALEEQQAKAAAVLRTLVGINKTAQAEFNTALANAGKDAVAVVNSAEAAIQALDRRGLSALKDGFAGVQKAVADAKGEFVDLENRAKAFGLRLAELTIRKAGLEDAKDAAEDLAKSAKGAFDNTNKTIRAFRRNVQETVRDIRSAIGNRVFELRAEIRLDSVTKDIEELRDKRQAIEVAGQKRIDEARLNTEKAYFKSRLEANLASVDFEIRAVEESRAQIEEAALRDRIKRLEARSNEFIRLAQAAALRGDVDSALGLTEAARNATKEIGNVIEELTNLEQVSEDGGRRFQLREGELLNLIADLNAQEQRVSKALPGINTTLKDTTQAAVDSIQGTLDRLNETLVELNTQISRTVNLLGDQGAAFQASVGAATDRSTAALNRSGRGNVDAAAIASAAAGGLVLSAKEIEQRDKQIEQDAKILRSQQGLTDALNRNTGAARAVFDEPVQANAEGGLIKGPGTSKSDSILSRLSRGEFVVNAATTRKFGAGFFHRLQALAKRGQNLDLPGFATGGLGLGSFEPVVQAAGTGGAPIHIHLPGGDTLRLREGADDTTAVKRIARREALKRGVRAR